MLVWIWMGTSDAADEALIPDTHWLDDPACEEFLYTALAKAYLECVDALEWILDIVKNDAQPQFDLNFAPDKPGLLMRRVLHRHAATEADFRG